MVLSATSRPIYFSFLASWLGVGGPEQVPHLPAERLLLGTEGTGTIWLWRRWEQDGSDQGQAFCPRVPYQLALPAIPHTQAESKHGARFPPLPSSLTAASLDRGFFRSNENASMLQRRGEDTGMLI